MAWPVLGLELNAAGAHEMCKAAAAGGTVTALEPAVGQAAGSNSFPVVVYACAVALGADPLLEQVVAACRHSGVRDVRTPRRRSGGELSSVYEVNADGRALIVKIYSPEWAWKQRKEVHVYDLMRGVIGDLVPRIVDVQEESAPLGFAYTVMTCLTGQPLSEADPVLDQDAIRELYRAVGRLAAAMHTVGQDAFGYIVTSILDPKPDNASYMRSQFDKKIGEFVAAGDPAGLSEDIHRRLAADESSFQDCGPPVLCHNDLHEGNLLVDRAAGSWELTGLIDVENAIAADPLLDLAKTHVYSIRDDRAKARGLAEGYGLDLDSSAEARFDLYRIYHTLELWDWYHQIGRREPLPALQRQLAQLLRAAPRGS